MTERIATQKPSLPPKSAAAPSTRGRSKGLLGWVGIQPGEGRTVVPALAFSFLAVGAQLVTTIAADSLFVSTFSLGAMSRFLVVSSIVRVAVAFAYAALSTRSGGAALDASVFGGTAVLALVSGLLARTPTETTVYAINIAQLILPPLLPLVAFNAAMSCFHTRQAKRLLPLVAAAGTVGSMAVGGVARGLATILGTGALLYVAALMCVIALPLPSILSKRAREAGNDDAPRTISAKKPALFATLGDAARDVRDVGVVRIVVLNAVLVAAAVAIAQFAFKASLKAQYGADEMAGFIGAFSTISEAVVLVAQVFFTSRFVARFGVRLSLESVSGALAASAPLVAFVPGVAATTAARFANDVFRFSLAGPTSDLLLTPAHPAVRTRAKVFVKGIAAPLGSTLAGLALGAFGDAGPSPNGLGAIFFVAGMAGVLATRHAKRAYTQSLAAALGEGRVLSEVSPASAAMLRSELARLLSESAAAGDAAQAKRVLAVMSDRLFSLGDLETALNSPSMEVRRDALRMAEKLARPGEGDRLLAAAHEGEDLGLEREALAVARRLGGHPSKERLERALARATGDDAASIDLWAEALTALTAFDKDGAVKKLRKAALGPDGPRRAAALHALGDLGERRAEREILRAMGSEDGAVFAEAARAAVLVDGQGAIATLVARLSTGPHVRGAARALALAGPRAANELLAALPTTRGEKAILPTAVASDLNVTGTIRAARVLARLGPEACARVLERFGDLGYRARNAVARSFAVVSLKVGAQIDRTVVLSAMDLTVRYAEGLVGALDGASPGLYRAELRHRIGETAARVLDLASVLGDRPLIAQARVALGRAGKDRNHALELLENVLPTSLAARTVALLDALPKETGREVSSPGLGGESEGREGSPHRHADLGARRGLTAPASPASLLSPALLPGAPHKTGGATPPARDGWLTKCEKFDRNELPSGDPMLSVLEKVLVLRDSSLFAGLSGEELYPVAEIAQPIGFEAGAAVVREGDPGDALFVVASGTLAIQKGQTKLREIGPGAAFGEVALLDGAPRAATIVAIVESRLLRIPREEFEALLDESPELSRGVIRTLIGHLRSSS